MGVSSLNGTSQGPHTFQSAVLRPRVRRTSTSKCPDFPTGSPATPGSTVPPFQGRRGSSPISRPYPSFRTIRRTQVRPRIGCRTGPELSTNAASLGVTVVAGVAERSEGPVDVVVGVDSDRRTPRTPGRRCGRETLPKGPSPTTVHSPTGSPYPHGPDHYGTTSLRWVRTPVWGRPSRWSDVSTVRGPSPSSKRYPCCTSGVVTY